MNALIDVYPYRKIENEIQFLVMHRAERRRYAGQWRMIGGKVEEGETRWQAGLRELKEETGCRPATYWTIPSVNQFYEVETDQIHHIAAFAAELEADEPISLNHEHDDHKWIDLGQINRYIVWPEQRRLIRLIDELITTETLLEDWIIDAEGI